MISDHKRAVKNAHIFTNLKQNQSTDFIRPQESGLNTSRPFHNSMLSERALEVNGADIMLSGSLEARHEARFKGGGLNVNTFVKPWRKAVRVNTMKEIKEPPKRSAKFDFLY